ncbi:MAG TPA: S46 family peptidase, partial [Leptospiraceae bacterium]|nr:S46 family peptidase [Leptospiraceae bacterium]
MTADTVFSDEGMWTLDNLPLKRLEKEYGKSPKPALLKKIQLASVRFNDGGSGSFVSKNGLLLTNHHVALGQLQKLSDKKNDYVRDGFYARREKDELKCPDLEVNILMSYENVTEKVLSAVRGGDAKEASDRRKKITSQIELDSFQKTGFRSNVIELYNGGEYWLYRYKKLTDIRLV